MRPKFRAWDKVVKEMAQVNALVLDEQVVKVTYKNGNVAKDDMKEYELMQSTGLFDRNGQEIFEGDIIQTSAFACIVGFGQYTYVGDRNALETEIGFYLSFLNIKPATYAPFDKYYWDNCEVIGNIHENELDLIMYEVSKFNKEIEDET